MNTHTVSKITVLMITAIFSSQVRALTLDYKAYAFAEPYASVGILGEGQLDDTSTWQSFDYDNFVNSTIATSAIASSTGTAFASVSAGMFWDMLEGPEGPMPIYVEKFDTQWTRMDVSAVAEIIDGSGVRFSSSILGTRGFENWGLEAVRESIDGGWTTLKGTLNIDADIDNPAGTHLLLPFSVSLVGDSAHPQWDWKLVVKRGTEQIAMLDKNGISQSTNVDVISGETLSYSFYHIPEPAAMTLLGLGALIFLRKK